MVLLIGINSAPAMTELSARLSTPRLRKTQLITLYNDICKHADAAGHSYSRLSLKTCTNKCITAASNVLLAKFEDAEGNFRFHGQIYAGPKTHYGALL